SFVYSFHLLSFPTRRSSDLLRWFGIIFLSLFIIANLVVLVTGKFYLYKAVWYTYLHGQKGPGIYDKDYFYSREMLDANKPDYWQDRKSTRLNSSHVKISYAV